MPDPDLLTIPEVAQLLRVSRGTVARWAANGVLHSVQLGRHRRVTRAALDGFLTQLEREGHVPPAWPSSREKAARAPRRARLVRPLDKTNPGPKSGAVCDSSSTTSPAPSVPGLATDPGAGRGAGS